MKWYKTYTLAMLLLPLFVGASDIPRNDYSKTESISKSFKVDENSYVELENKYGNIEINTWDNDSVKILVEMNYETKNYNDLEKLKSLFEIDFQSGEDFVIVATKWSDDIGIFKKSKLEISQSFGSQSLEINYTVFIPNNLELEITNKFGNVFMGSYSGRLKVDLSYGDFRARDLDNLKELNVSYGKVKIKSIDSGRVKFNSVKSAVIDDVNDLIINSSGSDIEIERAKTVNISSKHDNILFEEIDVLTGDMTLTDLEVDLLTKSMGTNTKFGSIRIKEIDAASKQLNLNGNRTDFRLGFSSFFSGEIDVTVSKELDFNYPEEFSVGTKGVDSEGNWNGKGFIGNPIGTKVIIVAENGFVEID